MQEQVPQYFTALAMIIVTLVFVLGAKTYFERRAIANIRRKVLRKTPSNKMITGHTFECRNLPMIKDVTCVIYTVTLESWLDSPLLTHVFRAGYITEFDTVFYYERHRLSDDYVLPLDEWIIQCRLDGKGAFHG